MSIIVINKRDCCGCNACVQRCPQQCIYMKEDTEGFLYPTIDKGSCIDCGLCEKVCPVINKSEEGPIINVYAAKNDDEKKRLDSSSGGLFIALAEHIISENGTVYGAVFDEKWEVRHSSASTLEELYPMMRSKYVQSKIGNTYLDAESRLKKDQKVLFIGTPCQIAGLKKYLRKEYDNLLAVDFICHGVPSPGVWRRYLKELINNQSDKKKDIFKINSINFREKRRGFNWKNYGFVIDYLSVDKHIKQLTSCSFYENPYMKGFLSDLYLRPSCYSCPAKGGTSGADITIADYWGIENQMPQLDDNKGVGLAIVHTEKGIDILGKINVSLNESDISRAIISNPSYWSSVKESTNREKFFVMFHKGDSICKLVDYFTKESKLDIFANRIKNILKGILYKSLDSLR